MYKLTKPLAIALGLVLISVLSLSLAYAYKTSLNPVIKPESTESLNQGLKTPYSSFINPKGILLGIILVSAAIIGFFVYKNAIIALLKEILALPVSLQGFLNSEDQIERKITEIRSTVLSLWYILIWIAAAAGFNFIWFLYCVIIIIKIKREQR